MTPDADAATTAVAPEGREAALTPSGPDRSAPRRDSRPASGKDSPAGPDRDLTLFPPEVETPVPRRRVRAPLRVRRSAHDAGGAGTREVRRRPASSPEASAPAAEARPRPARLGARIGAGLCDLALLAGLDALVVWLTLRLAGLDLRSLAALPLPPLAAFLFLLDVGYLVGLTAAGGQTIGKMAWGLRVADADGGAVSLPQAMARTFWTPVSLTLAVARILFGRGGRTLHDAISGTRVMTVSPPSQAPPEGGTA